MPGAVADYDAVGTWSIGMRPPIDLCERVQHFRFPPVAAELPQMKQMCSGSA
ncbi:hypothetical protein ACQP1W_32700 [Spirillospora sp. CA-255316]